MARYRIYLCGPTDCPHDPDFEHDNYMGCMPKDFDYENGMSLDHKQIKHGNRWWWDGGCDAATISRGRVEAVPPPHPVSESKPNRSVYP